MIDGNEISETTIWKYDSNENASVNYVANKYVLTLGDTIIDVEYDHTLGDLPDVPVKKRTGYTVTGYWAINGETIGSNTIWKYTSDQIGYAKYDETPKQYGVEFSGESNDIPENMWIKTVIKSVTYDSIKLEYTFTTNNNYFYIEGWYTEKDGVNKVIDSQGYFVANVVNYTDANGRWISTKSNTLYAHYGKSYENYNYIANTQSKLTLLLSDVPNQSNLNYMLIEDIELRGQWEPIIDFSGVFDGHEHYINCLKITAGTEKSRVTDYPRYRYGLFANVIDGGIVRNINMKDAHIEVWKNEDGYVDNFAAFVVGFVEKGDVKNCSAEESYLLIHCIRKNVTFWVYCGGITGKIRGGNITECVVKDSKINGQGYNGDSTGNIYAYVGDIVGYADGNIADVVISSCKVTNNFIRVSTANDMNNVASGAGIGGIAGATREVDYKCNVSDCEVTILNTSQYSSSKELPGLYIYKSYDDKVWARIGSIVGKNQSNCKITNCTSNITKVYLTNKYSTDKSVSIDQSDGPVN